MARVPLPGTWGSASHLWGEGEPEAVPGTRGGDGGGKALLKHSPTQGSIKPLASRVVLGLGVSLGLIRNAGSRAHPHTAQCESAF